jgi:hypothetical protein
MGKRITFEKVSLWSQKKPVLPGGTNITTK